MAEITLKDIRLSDYTLEQLDGIGELRDEMFQAPVHICTERAWYITQYMKAHTQEEMEEHPLLYRAQAVYIII